MVKIGLAPMKDKAVHWRYVLQDIQCTELNRLSFKEWSIKMASTGYFSELFRSMENERLS